MGSFPQDAKNDVLIACHMLYCGGLLVDGRLSVTDIFLHRVAFGRASMWDSVRSWVCSNDSSAETESRGSQSPEAEARRLE